MAGQGAGPSRRSHTKSRKGCKTCKRRHIRCDETFPQCRNCTKHQVRCDYMDAAPSDSESQSNPDQTSSMVHPNAEESIRTWQETGTFSYRELDVYPPPQMEQFSRNELLFIHNLSSVSESLTSKGLSNLSNWTPNIPKFLSLASSYPYVMHALHSFSANHLAWTSQSADLRKLSIQHGGVALRGLHEAISNFSASNADGVLAASLILTCQATDYRSWSSLEAGIRSVAQAMGAWKNESIFTSWIDGIIFQARSASEGSQRIMPSPQERYNILRHIAESLHNLRPLLSGNPTEESWFDQLIDYVARLQASEPAQTPEEQFNHLYVLRKWLYWLPVQLLDNANNEGPGMLVLAYLYATALALEPLFPDIGPTFCTGGVLAPLEEVIGRIAPVQSHQAYSEHSLEIASIMQFPQEALQAYKERNAWTRRHMQSPRQGSYRNSLHFDVEASVFSNGGNLSPAFAPSQLHLSPTAQLPSRSHSPFLELPATQYGVYPGPSPGFGYGTGQWGAMPSPNFPSQDFGAERDDQDQGDFGAFATSPFGGFSGGFVHAPTVWT